MRFENFMPRMRCKATVMALVSSTLALVSQLNAEPFVYNARDVLLGFRRVNGTKELLVNLGPSSNYFNAAPGAVIPITGFVPAQLANAFTADLSNLRCSVSAAVVTADGGDPSIPRSTLWMTRPRTNAAVRTVAWNRSSAISQGGAANKVASMGTDGQNVSNANPADPVENTPTAVTEPAGTDDSYSFYVSAGGNFGGNFVGNVEYNTGLSFTEPVRSDFYELLPGSGLGRYVGYFELRPDGTMIFQAASPTPPPAPPRPNIESIARVGTMTTISFTTTNDVTVIYRLRSTNSVGLDAPLSTWATSTATVTGNGQVRTLQDDSSDGDRFYSISASR